MWGDDDLDLALSTAMGMIEHSFSNMQPGQPLSTLDVSDKFVTVVFDLPGARRDEVLVTCTEEKVSVEAEFRRTTRAGGIGGPVTEGHVRYSKEVTLPVKVVPEKGTARFKNGMIIVKLPRRQERRSLKEPSKRLKLTA